MSYDTDPERGCGRKQPDAFYIEGVSSSRGTLNPWTWVLGNGMDKTIPLQLPPRKTQVVNIPATMVLKQVVWPDKNIQMSTAQATLYDWLTPEGVKPIGIADHVGASNYTAAQFAQEAMAHGVSRRITPDLARTYGVALQAYGAVPILFTHSKVPVFRSMEERDLVCSMSFHFSESDVHIKPTWEVQRWGELYGRWSAYSRDRATGVEYYDGGRSYLVHVLNTLDYVERYAKKYTEKSETDEERIAAFAGLHYQEQAFGISWVNRLTYTLPTDHMIDPNILDIPSITIVDLDAEGGEEDDEE